MPIFSEYMLFILEHSFVMCLVICFRQPPVGFKTGRLSRTKGYYIPLLDRLYPYLVITLWAFFSLHFFYYLIINSKRSRLLFLHSSFFISMSCLIFLIFSYASFSIFSCASDLNLFISFITYSLLIYS